MLKVARVLATALAFSQLVRSQLTTVTRPVFPSGEQDEDGSDESSIPLACDEGCFEVAGPYFFCFVNTTLPTGGQTDPAACDAGFCNSTIYDQLSACLNCIVANGNERPYGYHTNTSLTAGPTAPSPFDTYNPNGLIDAKQANEILYNVTERCSSIGRALKGASTITASPTTTGPYYTSWTANQTVSLTVWTGLTQYANPVVTYVLTMGTNVSGPTSSSSGGATQSASHIGAASRVGTVAPGLTIMGLLATMSMVLPLA